MLLRHFDSGNSSVPACTSFLRPPYTRLNLSLSHSYLRCQLNHILPIPLDTGFLEFFIYIFSLKRWHSFLRHLHFLSTLCISTEKWNISWRFFPQCACPTHVFKSPIILHGIIKQEIRFNVHCVMRENLKILFISTIFRAFRRSL